MLLRFVSFCCKIVSILPVCPSGEVSVHQKDFIKNHFDDRFRMSEVKNKSRFLGAFLDENWTKIIYGQLWFYWKLFRKIWRGSCLDKNFGWLFWIEILTLTLRLSLVIKITTVVRLLQFSDPTPFYSGFFGNFLWRILFSKKRILLKSEKLKCQFYMITIFLTKICENSDGNFCYQIMPELA